MIFLVCFCCHLETVNHLFLDCAMAKQLWVELTMIFDIPLGNALDSVGTFWLSNKRISVLNMITSATLWSLWKLRNDMLLENRLVEYDCTLGQDRTVGLELDNSLPGGQKTAPEQDLVDQGEDEDGAMASMWVGVSRESSEISRELSNLTTSIQRCSKT